MFKKVLVANRGEIAIRVMRTLREMGIASVAVYSEPDRRAAHVRFADEAYLIGPAASAESYLRVDKLVEIARRSGAEAVHPGYGFLSERAPFARALQEAEIAFIGPPPEAIEAMGSKTRARDLMREAGVPLVPGTPDAIEDPAEALAFAEEAGFPVLVKAAAGGGGKGMRRVDDPSQFVAAFEGAKREAIAAFGDGTVYVEKYVLRPKHVEFQVMADTHGQVIHLFERECSVQRRHQKIIEEAPCPVLTDATRREMGEVAVRAAQAVDYVGAGTIEFLLDADQNFYFLEMNTRLQVEHPITELITGLDLVREQVRVAAGLPLSITQDEARRFGHAIECRIYAEDPANNFIPSPGTILALAEPSGPGVRVDSGVYEGAEVSVHYDPMIAKLSVWGADRDQAIGRMRRALTEYVVDGITTNVGYHEAVLTHPDFVDGSYDTGLIERMSEERGAKDARAEPIHELAAALAVHRRDEALAGGAPSAAASAATGADRWTTLARWEQGRHW